MATKDLSGKVAIVTGASRGIGAAIAEALAREGCHVVLAARSEEPIRALAQRLHQDYGVDARAFPCDVSDAQQVHSLVAETERRWGGVDILINNAGMGLYGAMDEMRMEDLRHVFDVNFFGAVTALQAVVPVMRRRGGGAIVNISSLAGKVPHPLGGGYSATKYALQAVSGAARAELARDHIDVISVCPGLTETEFARHARISVPGVEGREGERQAPVRGVSPHLVAQRTVRALHRGEREVYVTWWDRLIVDGALAFPGLFDRLMVFVAWWRRRRFARAQGLSEPDREPDRETVIALPGWLLLLLLGGGAVAWWWRRRHRFLGYPSSSGSGA